MEETLKNRWRLMLGKDAGDCGEQLSASQMAMDKALAKLYDQGKLGNREVGKWLGEIRDFFPASVVQVMQQDAVKRFNLVNLLTEKEMLDNVVPDVNMVAQLVGLRGSIPEANKETARQIVRQVVADLMKRLTQPLQQAVTGALNRSNRIRNPRYRDMDWKRTILKNLEHYQPEYQTVIPEKRFGFGRKQQGVREIIICLDQSGSMLDSLVFASIFGAIMASLPSLKTRMVVFEDDFADLTDIMQDPMDILFGQVSLRGGTDINRALQYCETHITRPNDTVLILISDLYECGNEAKMRERIASIIQSGVQFVALLALNDKGKADFDKDNAQFIANLGAPAFACTPDKFADLMGAALNRQDLSAYNFSANP